MPRTTVARTIGVLLEVLAVLVLLAAVDTGLYRYVVPALLIALVGIALDRTATEWIEDEQEPDPAVATAGEPAEDRADAARERVEVAAEEAIAAEEATGGRAREPTDGPFPSVPASGTVVCSTCEQPVDRDNDCEVCSSVGSWRK